MKEKSKNLDKSVDGFIFELDDMVQTGMIQKRYSIIIDGSKTKFNTKSIS
jgi:hypothetical protein